MTIFFLQLSILMMVKKPMLTKTSKPPLAKWTTLARRKCWMTPWVRLPTSWWLLWRISAPANPFSTERALSFTTCLWRKSITWHYYGLPTVTKCSNGVWQTTGLIKSCNRAQLERCTVFNQLSPTMTSCANALPLHCNLNNKRRSNKPIEEPNSCTNEKPYSCTNERSNLRLREQHENSKQSTSSLRTLKKQNCCINSTKIYHNIYFNKQSYSEYNSLISIRPCCW